MTESAIAAPPQLDTFRVVYLPEGPFTIRATDGELVDQQGVVGVTLLDTTTPSISPQGAT